MTPPQPDRAPRPRSSRASSGRYSFWRLLREGFTGQRGWSRAWAKAEPRAGYRVVIVGGGGHGLATAYYLATEYGIRDVAVVERGPIGLGNVGRNTTIIRSNYFLPDNIRFYEFSLKLWEGLERRLNFNAMVRSSRALDSPASSATRSGLPPITWRRSTMICGTPGASSGWCTLAGARFEIDILGEMRGATIRIEPLYDPQGLRLRS
jgi:FAD dependent oxidoreductase